MMLVCILPFQSVSAVDVPLKSGTDPSAGTNPRPSAQMLRSFATEDPTVIVSLNENELMISFSNHVGIANLTIVDQNGAVIYQDVVSTNASLESAIELSGWDSGNYTVKIAYGSTKLVGTFQL